MSIQLWLDLGFDLDKAKDLEIQSLQEMLGKMKINLEGEKTKYRNLRLKRLQDEARFNLKTRKIKKKLSHFSRALRFLACEWVEVGGCAVIALKNSLEKTKEPVEFPLWEYTSPRWRETEWPTHPNWNKEYDKFCPENL